MTPELVLEVVRRAGELGSTNLEIATALGIPRARVADITSGRRWSSVTGIGTYDPNYRGHLAPEDVLEVVALRRDGYSSRDIADMFGIAHQNVDRILSGRTHQEVTGIGVP